uniref:Putative secreted protein n=1 Tax=Anopheles darlingi TaxID=43151 RepID=A0A2M4DIY8_ANODA
MKGYFTSCLYYCFLLLLFLLSLRDCEVVQETRATITEERAERLCVFRLVLLKQHSRNRLVRGAMCRNLKQNYKLEYQSESNPKYSQ